MFTLPKLPYAEDALEPHISAETLALHHGKHHKTYIDTLNKLLDGDALAELSLAEVRRTACWHHDHRLFPLLFSA